MKKDFIIKKSTIEALGIIHEYKLNYTLQFNEKDKNITITVEYSDGLNIATFEKRMKKTQLRKLRMA